MSFNRIFLLGGLLACCGAPSLAAPQAPQTNATIKLLEELRAMNPRIGELRQLVSQGADVNVRSDDGFPALHLAIWKSRKATKLLVAMGANLNSQNRNGDTPMAVAAEMGQIETVGLLFNEGADLNIRNFNGRTALGKARYMMSRPTATPSQRKRHRAIIDLLKVVGAKE